MRQHRFPPGIAAIGLDRQGDFLVADGEGQVARISASGDIVTRWSTGHSSIHCLTADGDELFFAHADLDAHRSMLHRQLGAGAPEVLAVFERSIGLADLRLFGSGELLAVVWKWADTPKGTKGIVCVEWSVHHPFYRWGTRIVALRRDTGETLRSRETNPEDRRREGRKDGRFLIFPEQGLVLCRDEARLSVLDAATFASRTEIGIDWPGIERVDLSADGRLVLVSALAGKDRTYLACFDIAGTKQWSRHRDGVSLHAQGFSTDGRAVYASWADGLARLDTATGRALRSEPDLAADSILPVGENLLILKRHTTRLLLLDGETFAIHADHQLTHSRPPLLAGPAGSFVLREGDGDLLWGQSFTSRPPALRPFAHVDDEPRQVLLSVASPHQLYVFVAGKRRCVTLDANGMVTSDVYGNSCPGFDLGGRSVNGLVAGPMTPLVVAEETVLNWSGDSHQAQPWPPRQTILDFVQASGARQFRFLAGATARVRGDYQAFLAELDSVPALVVFFTDWLPGPSFRMPYQAYNGFAVDVPCRCLDFLDDCTIVTGHDDGRIRRLALAKRQLATSIDVAVTAELAAFDDPIDHVKCANQHLIAAAGARLRGLDHASGKGWELEFPSPVTAVEVAPHADVGLAATTGGVTAFRASTGKRLGTIEVADIVSVACHRGEGADFAILAGRSGELFKVTLDAFVSKSTDGASPRTTRVSVRTLDPPMLLRRISAPVQKWPDLQERRMDWRPRPPVPALAPYRCSTCGEETSLLAQLVAPLRAAESKLAEIERFSLRLDARQYCPTCRDGLTRRGIQDFRSSRWREPFGSSVRVVVGHPGLDAPETLWMDIDDVGLLATMLSGSQDHLYLDPSGPGLNMDGGRAHRKLLGWYRAMTPRLRPDAARPARHTIEPRLLDFEKVRFDEPVCRRLRLVNPEDQEVLFSFLGAVGLSDAELVRYDLRAEELTRMPYRYALSAEDLRAPWYRGPGKFVVAPRTDLEIPIVVHIRRDSPHANSDLQVSTSRPAAGPEIVSRFTVRIAHRGPKGWAWEEP